MHYSENDSTTRLIVAAVWVLDTLHVSFNNQLRRSADFDFYRVVSILVNILVISIVQLFFAYKIYHLCRRELRWLMTAPIYWYWFSPALALVCGFFPLREINSSDQEAATVATTLTNDALSYATRTRHSQFYTAAPAVCTLLLSEVLNTGSLCVLLYDKSSRSAVPRTKRLLNTLIVYAINRCLLTFRDLIHPFRGRLVVIAEAAVDIDDIVSWTMATNFLTSGLYANSLLASLNTRQHLRSQGSSLQSDLGANSVHFANSSKVSEDTGSSKDVAKRIDKCEVAVIDIATRGAFDKTATLQRAAEV
ncbi:hypothetical protein EDD16DRAFT_1523388 [Pisolithus croceorrhizus]|nr:hypothetical protein EDD16DRAFT_1523388 [Pisolithus croceorrhizus]KAI6143194.1 hypothetical protein EDD17DRAFT_1515643 [Pisolithus thermaeus]